MSGAEGTAWLGISTSASDPASQLGCAIATKCVLWAMDFMHDTLASDREMRVLTAIDVYAWEWLALGPAAAFSGADVAKIRQAAGAERGQLPARIKVDNGTGLTSKSLDAPHGGWGG